MFAGFKQVLLKCLDIRERTVVILIKLRWMSLFCYVAQVTIMIDIDPHKNPIRKPELRSYLLSSES